MDGMGGCTGQQEECTSLIARKKISICFCILGLSPLVLAFISSSRQDQTTDQEIERRKWGKKGNPIPDTNPQSHKPKASSP